MFLFLIAASRLEVRFSILVCFENTKVFYYSSFVDYRFRLELCYNLDSLYS